MPLFALIGRDGPRGGELRALHRPAHLEGIEALDRRGRIHHAGPLLGEDGRPRGSLVIFEAPDRSQALRVAEADPYVRGGVFASWEVLETRALYPAGGSGTDAP